MRNFDLEKHVVQATGETVLAYFRPESMEASGNPASVGIVGDRSWPGTTFLC